MNWPWRKKIEPATKPEPKQEVDDWRPAHGDWKRVTVCHCGYVQQNGEFPCPLCGHMDKWSVRVQRRVWEESPSRRVVYHYGDGFPSFVGPKHRNESIEVWDETKCGVNP